MLINTLGESYGSVIVAAFSGAAIFTLIQRNFYGRNKFIIFLISFFMGIEGADTTVSLVRSYFLDSIHIGRVVGAFLCSALIVKVAMIIISRVEIFLSKTKGK